MRIDEIASSHNDEWYTPEYAVEPLLKYIEPNSTVWCPFDTDESNYVKVLRREGHTVLHGSLLTGQDFFEVPPPRM